MTNFPPKLRKTEIIFSDIQTDIQRGEVQPKNRMVPRAMGAIRVAQRAGGPGGSLRGGGSPSEATSSGTLQKLNETHPLVLRVSSRKMDCCQPTNKTLQMSTTVKSTYWSLTINNPTQQDDENIVLAIQKGWKITGQKEAGENGTIHYQAMLHTPNQTRFSAVKKIFPRAHIEIAKNPIALRQYVEKEETRIGQLTEESRYYPTLSKYWILITEILIEDSISLSYLKRKMDSQNITLERALFDIGGLENYDLADLDFATGQLIRLGYHVETIAVNPSTRSAWKNYFRPIIMRSLHSIFNQDNQHNNAPPPTEEESSDQEIQIAEIPTTPQDADDPYA